MNVARFISLSLLTISSITLKFFTTLNHSTEMLFWHWQQEEKKNLNCLSENTFLLIFPFLFSYNFYFLSLSYTAKRQDWWWCGDKPGSCFMCEIKPFTHYDSSHISLGYSPSKKLILSISKLTESAAVSVSLYQLRSLEEKISSLHAVFFQLTDIKITAIYQLEFCFWVNSLPFKCFIEVAEASTILIISHKLLEDTR